MKITFYFTHDYDKTYFDANNQTHQIQYVPVALTEETARLAQGSAAICAFVNDKLDETVIRILSEIGVRLIAMRSAGYNNVDLQAAKRYGLTVVRVPAYSPHAVAEHTLALILTLNRKTHKAYNRVRDGNFSLDRLLGFDLYGKSVGVVGTGRIGSVFCRIMLGLGCQVLAYDIQPNPDLADTKVQYTTLPDLFQNADILSLHCPLNESTHYLINPHHLSLMKKGAMLINTSRGGLIDTKAVIKALKTGHLGSLGLDVYEQEDKLFFRDFSDTAIKDEMILRLMSFPNVLITAHQAFFTHEAMTEIAKTTLQNISDFEKGLPLKNVIL